MTPSATPTTRMAAIEPSKSQACGRAPLVAATATHLVVSQSAVLRLLVAMALVGVALGVIGLREAFTRLPADGDVVLTVAIVVASALTAATLFVGLVAIPRRVRRSSTR